MEKTCTKCGKGLTEDKFNKNKNTKDGLRSECKKCLKRYREDNKEFIASKNKQYYQDNKEILIMSRKVYRDQYYQDHKADAAEYSKPHYQKNKVSIAAYHKKWHLKNKVVMAEYAKQYGKNNRDKLNIMHQRRRSIKRQLPSTLNDIQWKVIKIQFDNCCAYCGKELPIQQEHFVPLSKGGEYTHNNIIPACQNCNYSKHDSTFFEWYPTHKSYNKSREIKILKYLNYDKRNNQQLSIL